MGSRVHGGYKLSNESLLERLSCNIFITIFPVHLSAKELWNTCAQYGTVQDVYILKKLSKQGKPFAFARFNKNSASKNIGEDDIAQSEECSDNNSVGIHNWEEENDVENYDVQVKNSREISPEQLDNSPDHVENSLVHVENSPEQMENFSDHVENSFVHVENSHVYVENSLDLFEDPFGNKAAENVAHEGISSLGIVKSVPKNMSPAGSKHDHVDSLAPSPKPINGFSILERFQEFISIGQAMGFGGYTFAWSDKHASKMKSHMDYGPTLFCLFHSWILEQDFASVVEDSWNNDGSIQKKSVREHDRKLLQDYLLEIDSRLDKGEGLPDDLPNRANTFHDIGVIDCKISVDLAKKAKWIDNPGRVKRDFYNHFTTRFSAPDLSRVPMEGAFPRRLGVDSSHDLEGDISNDEIKKAVWDYGSDKSSGPNGFTFEFLKNYGP
ncbi:RNA-directed DNA polymerase, eukaryota [Tanacetum coccineum]